MHSLDDMHDIKKKSRSALGNVGNKTVFSLSQIWWQIEGKGVSRDHNYTRWYDWFIFTFSKKKLLFLFKNGSLFFLFLFQSLFSKSECVDAVLVCRCECNDDWTMTEVETADCVRRQCMCVCMCSGVYCRSIRYRCVGANGFPLQLLHSVRIILNVPNGCLQINFLYFLLYRLPERLLCRMYWDFCVWVNFVDFVADLFHRWWDLEKDKNERIKTILMLYYKH